MMKLLLEFLNFLMAYCPLLMSLAMLTLLVVLLADSIKKHAKYYYLFFGLIALLTLVQYLDGFFEFMPEFSKSVEGSSKTMRFNLFRDLPVLGPILRANFHMLGFGFPLLIIIMYVGALNPRRASVKKVLKIRKELSLIAGCPVLCHSLFRVTRNFISSITFFADREAVIAKRGADQLTGLTLTNLGFLLGIVLVILFLILWITSFTSVHRRLGSTKWKKIQKWSYLLYALLFVHSILLHSGWFLTSMAREMSTEAMIKDYIALASTTLIFGSYLFLRVRKAKASSRKKK